MKKYYKLNDLIQKNMSKITIIRSGHYVLSYYLDDMVKQEKWFNIKEEELPYVVDLKDYIGDSEKITAPIYMDGYKWIQ